jgi:hypothetical protein
MNFLDTLLAPLRCAQRTALTLANGRPAANCRWRSAPRRSPWAPPEPYLGQHGVEATIDQVEFLGAAQRLICTADTYLGPQQILVERLTQELPRHEQVAGAAACAAPCTGPRGRCSCLKESAHDSPLPLLLLPPATARQDARWQRLCRGWSRISCCN